MRVPWPAAMTITTGAFTARMVVGHNGSTTLGSGVVGSHGRFWSVRTGFESWLPSFWFG
jgi:hypothetical protein